MAFAGATLERPIDLVRLLDIGLKSKPNEAALVSLERTWSWRELDQASTRLAGQYLALGLVPGDRVASLMPNRGVLLVHYLAWLHESANPTALGFRRFMDCAGISSWIKSHSVRFTQLPSRKAMRNLMTVAFIQSALLLLTFCSDAAADTNWPQFRGPDARGVSSQSKLPDRWSAKENVAWKRDIPGRGWSSPIVWNDRVFLPTVINSGKSEERKKGLYFGGDRPKPPGTIHRWQVFCLDLNTGKVLWMRQVHEGKPESSIHLKNSYASETPVTDGERVYCYFGNLGVFCFDFDGKELWKHTVKPETMRFGWGTAASPVLHQGRLYVVNDNEKESYLLALDAKSGKQVWRTPRDEKSNWSTPFIWKNGKGTEIVTLGTGKVRSYDLDGNLLWWLKGMSSITTATPYEHNGLLYFSSGYVLDPSRPIYAVRPGAKGDISLKAGESSNEFIAWSRPKDAPYNPTSLLYNDRLYVLLDRGFVSCFDPRDGKEIYSQKRLPNGRAFTSSPWACAGKVFCLSEDGVTFVLQAGDEFKVLHTNPLSEDDMCMATPALAGDRLLIRTAARLYCIAASPSLGKRRGVDSTTSVQEDR